MRPAEVAVYGVLLQLAAKSEHGIAFPSRKALADLAGLKSEKTVTAALVALQVRRLITRRVRLRRRPDGWSRFYVSVVLGVAPGGAFVAQSGPMALLLAGDDDLGAERISNAVKTGELAKVPVVVIARKRCALADLVRPHHRTGSVALVEARRELARACATLLGFYSCHTAWQLYPILRPSARAGSPRPAGPIAPGRSRGSAASAGDVPSPAPPGSGSLREKSHGSRWSPSLALSEAGAGLASSALGKVVPASPYSPSEATSEEGEHAPNRDVRSPMRLAVLNAAELVRVA